MSIATADPHQEKREMMTTVRVEPLILKLALPTVAIMMVSSFYNMADTYFVSTLGTSAVAAVGIAHPIMSIIHAIGIFFGQGAGNSVARMLGAGKNEEATVMASTGCILSFALTALFVTLPCLLLTEPLAILMGATPTMLPFARTYFVYIFLAAPWIAASLVLNSLLRFQGSAFYSMVGMCAGAVINLILDVWFMFILKLGIGGAALSTMIGEMVSFLLLLAGCFFKDNLRIRLKNVSLKPRYFKEMFRGGFPALIRNSIGSLSGIVINNVAAGFGDALIASMSIAQRISVLALSAVGGLGQGFQPVCGFNYGAGLYSRVKKGFWFCIRISALVLLFAALAMAAFAPQLISLFRLTDSEVIRLGTRALRLSCLTYPFMGWVTIFGMMLQTMGKTLPASILAVAWHGLFQLPCVLLLAPLLGELGVQISSPVSMFLTLLLTVPLAISVFKGLNQNGAAPPGKLIDGSN